MQLIHRNKMPFQHPCGHGVNVHLDVGVRHVNPDDLRVGAGHSLNGDAVILLLVDDFDAKRNARRSILKIRRVIQQDGAVAHKVARRPQRAADSVRGPAKHLVLR